MFYEKLLLSTLILEEATLERVVGASTSEHFIKLYINLLPLIID